MFPFIKCISLFQASQNNGNGWIQQRRDDDSLSYYILFSPGATHTNWPSCLSADVGMVWHLKPLLAEKVSTQWPQKIRTSCSPSNSNTTPLIVPWSCQGGTHWWISSRLIRRALRGRNLPKMAPSYAPRTARRKAQARNCLSRRRTRPCNSHFPEIGMLLYLPSHSLSLPGHARSGCKKRVPQPTGTSLNFNEVAGAANMRVQCRVHHQADKASPRGKG